MRDAQGNMMSTYEENSQAGTILQQEISLYGSSRLGVLNVSTDCSNLTLPANGYISTFERGKKFFELTNHLGNVLSTVSDRLNPIADASGNLVAYYQPDITSATDYYAFGMQMPGRSSSSASYRYGFNGKENDNDVKGTGNQQDYGERIYDNRVGRFLSVDPITKSYPMLTPYQFASNRPIDGIDWDGLEFVSFNEKNTSTIVFQRTRDETIEKEYQAALKSNMNVLVANSLSEINGYLEEKNTKYSNLLFGGHGPYYTSAIRLGAYTYDEKNMDTYKEDLKKLGTFVKKDGQVTLLACMQAASDYKQDVKTHSGKVSINVDGLKLIRKLSSTLNLKVIANAGLTPVSPNMFSDSPPLAKAFSQSLEHPYGNMSQQFYGHWFSITPDGTTKDIGTIGITKQGVTVVVPTPPSNVSSSPMKSDKDEKKSASPPPPSN